MRLNTRSDTEHASSTPSAEIEMRRRLKLSATCPAKSAMPMNGSASANPIKPSDKGSCVMS